MKKLSLLTVLFSVLLLSVTYAQKRRSADGNLLSVGLELGIPTGTAADVYTIGFGGSAKFEMPVDKSFNFTVTAGYTSLFVKDALKPYYASSSTGYIPIKAGVKYFIAPNFYGEGEMGVAIGTSNNAGNAFAYAPGLGLSFPISNGSAFDAGLRYEGWSKNGTLGQIGLRVAYKFKL